MGAFNFEKQETLNGKPQDVLRAYFRAADPEETLRLGAELEVMLGVHTKNGARLLADHENYLLKEAVGRDYKGAIGRITNEPGAHMMEVVSSAQTVGNAHHIPNEIAALVSNLAESGASLSVSQEDIDAEKAKEHHFRVADNALGRGELFISPFTVAAFARADECRANLITPRSKPGSKDYSDRPRLMMKSFSQWLDPVAVPYPVTNVCVHLTHGVRDEIHAFEMSRLQAAMMPFLFVLAENRPPYQNGSTARTDIHTGLQARSALNLKTEFNQAQRGMAPDFLFEAKDHEEFIHRFIDYVCAQPMMAYWDHDGNFNASDPSDPVTPTNMHGKGPETVDQFILAASGFWWNFKYKFRAGEGPSGILHELRDFDTSPDSVKNMSLMMGMLAMDNDIRADFISRLENKYGIPIMSDPMAAKTIIDQNTKSALRRGNSGQERFLLTPFGNNGHTMLELLRNDLMPLIERFMTGHRHLIRSTHCVLQPITA